ncbi:MAG: phosphatase domain-containing protein [Myxococcota bacterium]
MGRLVPEQTIYRWDLDKTYLRTEFDTIQDLLRTAVEPAARKQTVPGASALLRELRATGPAAISILSGSPRQMRRVLEAKLRLDGIEWDSLTLKPSLRNLLKGRVRFIKDQVSYKLGALIDARVRSGGGTQEVLFGDDAEADAFIYSLYADLMEGRVGMEQLMAVLERARVYPADIPHLVRSSGRLPRGETVRRIFIHLDRVSAPEVFREFGHRVFAFHNYFQPALVLMGDGALPPAAVLRVAADIATRYGFTSDALAASFMDAARRRAIGKAQAAQLVEACEDLHLPIFAPVRRTLEQMAEELQEAMPRLGDAAEVSAVTVDYADLFSRDRARARAARSRAKWKRRRK